MGTKVKRVLLQRDVETAITTIYTYIYIGMKSFYAGIGQAQKCDYSLQQDTWLQT